MEVTLTNTKRRVKRPVIRDHYWYDHETQQRLHGRGGRMIFVYDRENKKSVPRIVDHEDWIQEDSYNDILKWVEETNADVQHKAPGLYVTIDVDVADWPDIEVDLYRQKILFDYDAHELAKEMRAR